MPSGTTTECFMTWKNNKGKLSQVYEEKVFIFQWKGGEQKCSWQFQIGLNWKEMAAAQ